MKKKPNDSLKSDSNIPAKVLSRHDYKNPDGILKTIMQDIGYIKCNLLSKLRGEGDSFRLILENCKSIYEFTKRGNYQDNNKLNLTLPLMLIIGGDKSQAKIKLTTYLINAEYNNIYKFYQNLLSVSSITHKTSVTGFGVTRNDILGISAAEEGNFSSAEINKIKDEIVFEVFKNIGLYIEL